MSQENTQSQSRGKEEKGDGEGEGEKRKTALFRRKQNNILIYWKLGLKCQCMVKTEAMIGQCQTVYFANYFDTYQPSPTSSTVFQGSHATPTQQKTLLNVILHPSEVCECGEGP